MGAPRGLARLVDRRRRDREACAFMMIRPGWRRLTGTLQRRSEHEPALERCGPPLPLALLEAQTVIVKFADRAQARERAAAGTVDEAQERARARAASSG